VNVTKELYRTDYRKEVRGKEKNGWHGSKLLFWKNAGKSRVTGV